MSDFAENILPHTNAPCRKCPDRFYKDGRTCHETCEKYKKFREEREKVWEERANAFRKDDIVSSFKTKAIKKSSGRKPTER